MRLFLITMWYFALNCAAAPYDPTSVDVEKTITQVENILKQNTHLPRLSRDEILELLHDIRSEDETKFKGKDKAISFATFTNDLSIKVLNNDVGNELSSKKPDSFPEPSNISASTQRSLTKKPTTERNEDKLMVVLPYTKADADGDTLQELFTRPPRVALLHAPSPMKASKKETTTTKKPIIKSDYDFKPIVVVDDTTESKIKNKRGQMKYQKTPKRQRVSNKEQLTDDSTEFKHFLKEYGIDSNSKFTNTALGDFKPLPPVVTIDGKNEAPESLFLSYDMLGEYDTPAENAPEFELEAVPSEIKQTILALEEPIVKVRSVSYLEPSITNDEPSDYDSLRVIPLQNGPNPLDESSDEKVYLDKRQNEESNATTNAPNESSLVSLTTEEPSTIDKQSDNEAPIENSSPSISDLESSFGGPAPDADDPSESLLPPPKKNGFYFMLDWNSFLEVGEDDKKVNIRFEPKIGDPKMFLPVTVP